MKDDNTYKAIAPNGTWLSEKAIIDRNAVALTKKGVGVLITKDILQKASGLLPINCNGKIGFIDNHANIIVEAKYDEISEEIAIYDLYVGVCQDDKWGLIDVTGRLVLDCIYRKLSPLYLRHYMVVQNFEYQYAVIDLKTKRKIIPYGKYSLIYVYGEYLMAEKEGKRGLIDLEEHVITPFKYKWIDVPEHGLTRVIVSQFTPDGNELQRWGIIDINGNYVISPNYDHISRPRYEEGFAWGELNDEIMKLDLSRWL